MASDASELHNKLAPKIVRQIVEPVLEQGGTREQILVIAESVMAGVIEFCARNDGVSRSIVFEHLAERVRGRLEEFEERAR